MEKNETKTMKTGSMNLFEFLNKLIQEHECSPCFYNADARDKSGLSISIEDKKVTIDFLEKLLHIQYDYNYIFDEQTTDSWENHNFVCYHFIKGE